MKLKFKIFLYVGLAALLIGATLFFIGFAASRFDFDKMTGLRWNEKAFTENSEISSLKIDVDNSDITIKYEKDAEKISLTYFECINRKDRIIKSFTVTESNGMLSLSEKTNWRYQLYFWTYKDIDVVVTIPEGRTLSLDLSTDNGSVTILGNANINDLSISSDNGDIEINGTINVNENIKVESDNGDIEFFGSLSAKTIDILTDNGSFEAEGTLHANVITAETDNGNIECEDAIITANEIVFLTDNGDVEACLYGAVEDYKITVDTDNGDSNVDNSPTGTRVLYIETDNGDARIYFSNK